MFQKDEESVAVRTHVACQQAAGMGAGENLFSCGRDTRVGRSPRTVLPPATSLASPKSVVDWGPSILIHEPMGDISHPNCFVWIPRFHLLLSRDINDQHLEGEAKGFGLYAPLASNRARGSAFWKY